ncbi:AraC family transcriptional regulator [Rhodopseudomonas palustris]|uniref:AraC family transcriptional regulator n=1 Tax=Rhodopseudomonas palustris TaxID=1076 RepID=A0A323UF55_RHOPL|nr:acetamidase/formamidase family protein [Rhodopseudomonas palustris]PZA11552.1 AraC family transcriptional regulator [Rhodopseudomonas palustris]
MTPRPFTSESYSEGERPEAWRDVLASVGLRPAVAELTHKGHATAVRRSFEGITLATLSAGPQTVAALPDAATDHPLLLLPLDDGVTLKAAGGYTIAAAGHLLLLPRLGDWSVAFQRDLRAVVLCVDHDSTHRRAAVLDLTEPQQIAPGGFGDLVGRMLDTTARHLETLSAPEWSAAARTLCELLPTLLQRSAAPATDLSAGTSSKAATLHRLCQTIERRLDDPELSPAKVAAAEGISERYLQKLFGGAGSSFTHYLRERRLQRTRADLSNPGEAHHSISEIAFRAGFNDSAHFSRAFRHRFGVSPREFRQAETERHATTAAAAAQRGWPQQALAQLRSRPPTTTVRKPDAAALQGPRARPAPEPQHHHLAADASKVHWGYFSRSLAPQIEIASGDTITIETLTQHASDDPERMILGDAGAENVFHWTHDQKNVDRRGAGPVDASIYGRGAGEGFGVHICTGPVAVKDAQPGDVLEIRILDIVPRASRNPDFKGRVFGSSVAAWWGYHYKEFLAEQHAHEAVTIYEIHHDADAPYARALYSYRWEPQTDPFGTVHATYDYPGVPVQPSSVRRRHDVLDGLRIPLRPHFGVIALAPREADFVDSVPPAYFGGNLDNWRLGKGSTVYLPVSVPGALLSVGDPHAAQGDGELGGTAIECSMTGTFEVVLHKKTEFADKPFADLSYPLIETATDWVLMGFSHPNYLAEFGAGGQSEVYATSSLDLAMKDAFRKMRRFLMTIKGLSEDEAIALMSVAVDFGVTQVVDGNWGVHAILSKRVFADARC